ncbi:MAG: hypothetical protein VKI63_06050 [Cyanobium sp.]|nr:hypothetical protein [Cyanobium sp.]
MRSKAEKLKAMEAAVYLLGRIATPRETRNIPVAIRREARAALMRMPPLEELMPLLEEHLSDPRPPERSPVTDFREWATGRYRKTPVESEDGKLNGKLAELLAEAPSRVRRARRRRQGS